MMSHRYLYFLASIYVFSVPSHAISMRDDIPQSSYVDLSLGSDFESTGSLVQFPLRPSGEYCTLTLINPRTALLAAHCLVGPSDDCISPNCQILSTPAASLFGVALGATSDQPTDLSAISMYIPHQMYNGSNIGANDIALVAMNRRIPYVKYPQLAEESYEGSAYTLIGYGTQELGSGNTASMSGAFGQRLACNNILDQEVSDFATLSLIGSSQAMLIADFDCPSGCGVCDCNSVCGTSCNGSQALLGVPSSAVPLLLEGISTGGDSGGPVYIQRQEATYIAGVVSAGLLNNNVYGQIDLYTPTHLFLDWIHANNPLRQVSWIGGSGFWSDSHSWSELETPNNYEGPLHTNLAIYYETTLESAVSIEADINFTVDLIRLNHPQAALIVPSGKSPVSYECHLEQGSLSVDGTLSSSFILNGGHLNGSGTLRTILPNVSQPPSVGTIFRLPPLDNQGATLTPGSSASIGVLRIEGDYQQGPEGILEICFDAQDTSVLHVTSGEPQSSGNAALDGKLLLSNLNPSEFNLGKIYSFIEADSIVGLFNVIETVNIPSSLQVALTYLPQEVQFQLLPTTERSPLFTSYIHYTSLTQDNQFILRLLHNMHTRAASPVSFDVAYFADSPFIKQALANNTQSFQQISPSFEALHTRSHPGQFYYGPKGAFGTVETHHGVSGFSYDAIGGFLGADYAFSHGGVGVIFDYTYWDCTGKQQSGSLETHTLDGGVYGQWIIPSLEMFSINTIWGVGYSWDTLMRKVPLMGTHLKAQGETHTLNWNGCTGVEYAVPFAVRSSTFEVTPLAYLQYGHTHMRGFEEKRAGLFNLIFNSQNTHSLSSITGMRLMSQYPWVHSALTIETDLMWQHQFLSPRSSARFTSALADLSSSVMTASFSRNAFLGGVITTYNYLGKYDFQLAYNVTLSTQERQNFIYFKTGFLF